MTGGFLAAYLAVRIAMTLQVASAGLKQRVGWQALALIPLWDAMAFVIWLASFTRRSIRWRDRDYYIRNG